MEISPLASRLTHLGHFLQTKKKGKTQETDAMYPFLTMISKSIILFDFLKNPNKLVK